MLEKTLESPLDSKIKPVKPEGNHSWIFIVRTDAEAEALIFWPLDAKHQLIGKDVGKDCGQEKGATEDEMVGWHHWLNGHESEQTPEDSEGQGGLACCSPWGYKESDTTEWLNSKLSLELTSNSQDKTLYLLAAISPPCHTGSEILTMLVIVRQWLVFGFSL